MVLTSELQSNRYLLDKENNVCYCIVKTKPGSGYIFLTGFKQGDKEASLPEQYSISIILKRCEEGNLVLMESNPFLKQQRDYNNLSQAQISKIELLWPKVKKIVNSEDFYVSGRFKLIEEVA